MKKEKIYELFQNSQSKELEYGLTALGDLGLLIEKHTLIRESIDTYKILLNDESLLYITLDLNDIELITYFLFYMLFNYPDRSWRVAWCLSKCYSKKNIIGLGSGIEFYMNKDDNTTCYLIRAITDINSLSELDESIIHILNNVRKNGLSESKKEISRSFKLSKYKLGKKNNVFI
jgi:hypothetical protein